MKEQAQDCLGPRAGDLPERRKEAKSIYDGKEVRDGQSEGRCYVVGRTRSRQSMGGEL